MTIRASPSIQDMILASEDKYIEANRIKSEKKRYRVWQKFLDGKLLGSLSCKKR